MKYIVILITLMMITSLYCDILTLDDIKSIALNNNPDLKSQQESTKASGSQYYNSYTGLLPSATANGSYSTTDPGLEYDSYGLSANYTLFNGGKNIINILSNKKSYDMSKNTLSKAELATIATAETKYYALLQSSEYLQIAQMDLENAQELLQIGEIKHSLGTISKSDLLKLKSDKANKEVSVIQNKYSRELNYNDLAEYLQIPATFDVAELDTLSVMDQVEAIASLTEEEIDDMINKLLTFGTDHNYDIQNSQLNLESQKLYLWRSIGNFLPTLTLSVDKTWQKSELEADYSDSETLRLSASIPIFPIADNGLSVAQNRYNVKSSNYSLISAKTTINTNIKQGFYNLLTAAKSVKSAKASLDYSQELYEQNLSYYKNNTISTTDLQDASLLLSNSNYQYYASIYSYLMNKSNLLSTLATDNDEILNINK